MIDLPVTENRLQWKYFGPLVMILALNTAFIEVSRADKDKISEGQQDISSA